MTLNEDHWAILLAMADAQRRSLAEISLETGIPAKTAAILLSDLILRSLVDGGAETTGMYVIRAEGIEALLARG